MNMTNQNDSMHLYLKDTRTEGYVKSAKSVAGIKKLEKWKQFPHVHSKKTLWKQQFQQTNHYYRK